MEQAHAEPNYMGVFYWLAALTAVEVAVAYLPFTKLATGVILVVLAFTKASLVAMYFMHLKFERRTLAIIALTPVILCIMLMFMLLPDQHRIFSSTAAVSQPSTVSH